MKLRGIFGTRWNAAFSPIGLWLAQNMSTFAAIGARGPGSIPDCGPPETLMTDLSNLLFDNRAIIANPHNNDGLKVQFGPIGSEHTNPLVCF